MNLPGFSKIRNSQRTMRIGAELKLSFLGSSLLAAFFFTRLFVVPAGFQDLQNAFALDFLL